MSGGASDEPRIAYADISRIDYPATLGGKSHILKILKTSHGDFFVPATQVSMLLTEGNESTAFDHYRNVCVNCKSLKHNDEKLQDHVQVISV